MMYHKFIGDREVFSTCKTIELNGCAISNPSAEQIAEAGWTEYVPPVVPQTEPSEGTLVAAIKRMLQTETSELTDEEALEVAAAFPTWASKMGENVAVGERYWYDGKLYKVAQAHIVQADWTPSGTPALWVEVSIEEWPEWHQPVGAHDAYNTGDKVSHNDKHWESTCDGNIWEPSVYGWNEV